MDEWLLGKMTSAALQDLGLEENLAWQAVTVIKLLTGHADFCAEPADGTRSFYNLLRTWFEDGDLQRFIGVNRYQGILWFNREAFRTVLWWMYTAAVIEILAESNGLLEEAAARIDACYALVKRIEKAEQGSSYQVERLLEAAKE
jgi:hypothetical protein